MNEDLLRDLRVPVQGGVPTPATVFPRNNATPPVRPIPDGCLVLTTMSGIEHKYLNKDMPSGWRPAQNYLRISTPTGWVNWPWHSIFRFDTVLNSPLYKERLDAYNEYHHAATPDE